MTRISAKRVWALPRPVLGLLVLTCFFAGNISAADRDSDFSVQVWQTENGLPQNSVFAITQTPDGFLWLGTGGGLVRFDGLHFTAFTPANSPGLESGLILALTLDKSGALWAGTERGLTQLLDGKFRSYSKKDGLVNEIVDSLCVDREGTLWASGKGGLNRIKEGVITTIEPAGKPEGLRGVGTDRSGRLWAMLNGSGLFVHEHGRFEKRHPAGAKTAIFQGFYEDSKGAFWTGILYEGLVRWDTNGARLFAREKEVPAADLVSHGVAEAASGDIWFAFPPVGLTRFSNGRFEAFGPREGLPSVQLRSVFIDREDSLWVGTADNGFFRVRRKSVQNLDDRQGLRLYMAKAICSDGKGGMWVANQHDGLYRFENGRFDRISGGGGGSLWSLVLTRKGELFGGRYPEGVVRLPPNLPTPGVLAHPPDGTVQALLEDRSGAIWVATETAVHRYWEGKLLPQTRGINESFCALAEDREGAIWAGTENGGIVRIKEGGLTRFRKQEGLSGPAVRCVLVDDEGAVWAGTTSGLSRYENGRFQSIGSSAGLEDERINQLLDDGLGNLWLGCNMGIYRVSKQEIQACLTGVTRTVYPLSFGKQEGLLSLECRHGSQPNCMRGPDGKLYFVTLKSIAVIDPKNLSTNRLPPAVVIEGVTVDGAEVLPVFNSSGTRPLVIRPGALRVEYHFAGLNLSAPERVHYRYRLEGYDDEWVEGGARRFASYSRVPPGNYQFRVRAANGDGIWNQEGATLAVVFEPRFWQTLWFKGMSSLALLVAALGLYGRRIARLELRRIQQEAFSRELIASQEAERKRIAGELHDSLSQDLQLIRNRAQMALNMMAPSQKIAEQLKEISETSSKAIAGTRAISYALRPPELEHFGLTRAIESMVQRVAEASGLEASAELESIDGLLKPELEINLYRILQESLNNVVKHAQAKRVIVGIKKRPTQIEISIFDDGRGFADPRAFDGNGKRRGSLGLSGMKERAHLLGGALEIQSAPGKGTRLNVSLPVTSPVHGI